MRDLRLRLGLLGALALVGLPVGAGAQPAGAEFQINTYTSGTQQTLSTGGHVIAVDASGNFVVVWSSFGGDGYNYGISGQRYDSGGVALGSEFQVNSYTTNIQKEPSVAGDASGNFVVVWSSDAQAGSEWDVFGQRYDNAGFPQGGEFRVNSTTTSIQRSPSVASDAGGNFVVVWKSDPQDGSAYGIFGQRYDSAGVPLGSEFQVNSYTTSSQTFPSVASDASGNFVVVWNSNDQDGGSYGIVGQRYDSTGIRQGGEFLVNSYTSADQRLPSVASDASGNFVVVWFSNGLDGANRGTFGQRYDSTGVALGGEFQINSHTTWAAELPSVASDPSGNFVVVWQSNQESAGYSPGIFAQRYDSAGVKLGNEFLVNSYTTGFQQWASLAADGLGNFVVVWSSAGQDGSGYGVFGRRFDAVPSLSISDVSVSEGNLPGRASLKRALFTVTLPAPTTQTVTVAYATANGTAVAPSDYGARSGVLSFSPGQTSRLIAIVVKEDSLHENDESFVLNLSNPVNATIADGQGVGTIVNDDP